MPRQTIEIEHTNRKKYVVSANEKKIMKELVRNPRVSDKQISTKTKIPIKTVNRTRKKLENEGIVNYTTIINNFTTGTQIFNALDLFTFHFNLGITRMQIENLISSTSYVSNSIIKKHIMQDFSGEKNGRATYTALVASRAISDMVEIINAEIVPIMKKNLGADPIYKIEEAQVHKFNRFNQNYIPNVNMDKAKIKDSFPDENLFITE